MPFPKKTSRLELRDFHAADAPACPDLMATVAGWLNNPEVVRFSEQRHLVHNRDTQMSYFLGIYPPDKYIGIFLDNLLIGTITSSIDKKNSVANVGIIMGERLQWGKGYGAEAWIGVCDELFAGGVRKIEAGCMSLNYRMMAICQRYGMVEEGRQDKHFVIGNGTADLVHWGKFHEPSENVL